MLQVVLQDASNLLACICTAAAYMILIRLRYSIKVSLVSISVFVVLSFICFSTLVRTGMNTGMASAVSLTIPSLPFCYLLSKHRDSRFIFTFCTVDVFGILTISTARIAAIPFGSQPSIIFLFTAIGFFLLLAASVKIRLPYLRIQQNLNSGWRLFATVSVLFYALTYMIFTYPSPMLIERREYLPLGILFNITVLFVYVVIYQTVIKTVMVRDEQQEKELLETQLELKETQLKLNQIYYQMAYSDALTGLKNRAALEEKKDQLKQESDSVQIACISIDLNNLKRVNDRHGHEKGDALLKQFSEILQDVFSESESVYRTGGDEFIVLLSGKLAGQSASLIEELKKKIAAYNNKATVPISFAVGEACTTREDPDQIETLLDLADKKMYQNKREMKISNG
ncbi:MAG: GGDEF domain-containing protein [Eubacteriales bacterium]|nr:GGDEF domain-containing protein [Eubacteriales bacterium]